jgi:predicted RNA-binding protein Jag
VRKEEEKWREKKQFRSNRPQADEKVKQTIKEAEAALLGQMSSYTAKGLNAFQRKMIHRHFEKTQEYKSKTYRENDTDYVLKIFPVGQLRRLAEQKAQEVLMKGESEVLPPMGAFERFVIHEYLKDRSGIRTESFGEGAERHIEISPVFGRTLKKAKRRLTR